MKKLAETNPEKWLADCFYALPIFHGPYFHRFISGLSSEIFADRVPAYTLHETIMPATRRIQHSDFVWKEVVETKHKPKIHSIMLWLIAEDILFALSCSQ